MNESRASSRDWSRALGCVADDLTGATDLAGLLRRQGLGARLCFGVPEPSDFDRGPVAEVVIIALPIRSLPPDDALALAGGGIAVMRGLGITRFFDKYCSTFDSSDAGNIGPVADEMLELLSVPQCVHAPSYPEHGRTVYQGNLFVRGERLDRSPMRHHPRTPMTDADLVRLLGRQSTKKVGLLDWQSVTSGAVEAHLSRLLHDGAEHVIADALTDADLAAVVDALGPRLAAGGAPYGAAVARAMFPDRAKPTSGPASMSRKGLKPMAAVVSGSASSATRGQIDAFGGPVLRVSADAARNGTDAIDEIVREAAFLLDLGPVLVAAEEVGTRSVPSSSDASAMELALGRVAKGLVEQHELQRLVVAGGETSGAVATALGLVSVDVGPEVAPGVPWTFDTARPLALAFKSGNFGGVNFFADAFEALEDWCGTSP